MKTTRVLLAAALAVAASACSASVTAPEPRAAAGVGASGSTAPAGDVTTLGEVEERDGGALGSGGGR